MNWPEHKLKDFALENGIGGLTAHSLHAIATGKQSYTIDKAKRFLKFQIRINEELLKHPIIVHNPYTSWFSQGQQSHEQIKAFVVQFSVFSNLFLIAQLYKTINADSLESMRASKEILANEIGVIFKPPATAQVQDVDPTLVSTEGTIEGGTFRFRAAHFEWLLTLAEQLGLRFNDLGKRRHGSKETLIFCDELKRLYGSEDYLVSQASSYAVENWAAAGFWDQLVEGFRKFNNTNQSKLIISFFTWHAKLEAQHALHTQEELEEIYFEKQIDEDAFIQYGNEMLHGVQVFWNGLENQRLSMEMH